MALNNQEIEYIKTQADALEAAFEDFDQTLAKLTNGDSGAMHKLKMTVGETTPLGRSIASCGGSVVECKTKFRSAVDELKNVMLQVAKEAEASAAEAAGRYASDNDKIAGIKFE